MKQKTDGLLKVFGWGEEMRNKNSIVVSLKSDIGKRKERGITKEE